MNNKRKTIDKKSVERMKYEIANELGCNIGPDFTSRANGSIGGEITKRLVEMEEKSIGRKQLK